jgi:hypothetical protein
MSWLKSVSFSITSSSTAWYAYLEAISPPRSHIQTELKTNYEAIFAAFLLSKFFNSVPKNAGMAFSSLYFSLSCLQLAENYATLPNLGRGYFAGLRVTKRNKATVLLTLTLFQTPTLTLILT